VEVLVVVTYRLLPPEDSVACDFERCQIPTKIKAIGARPQYYEYYSWIRSLLTPQMKGVNRNL
jgi:hypothetical protein